ncbi:MAG: universal stress protein [Desulfobacterales bacterium]
MLPIRKIICPTDFSEPSREGFRNARLLAGHFGAQLLLVHVTAPVPITPVGHGATSFNVAEYNQEMEKNAQVRLNEFVNQEDLEIQVATTGLVYEGDPAEKIIIAAEDHAADLIVMATHGHSGWSNLITGSVTEKVIRTATRPVLTVQAPAAKAEDEL